MALTTAASADEVMTWSPACSETDQAKVIDERPGGLTLLLPAYSVVCLTLPDDADCRSSRAAWEPSLKASNTAADVHDVIELTDGWTLQIEDLPPVPISVDRGWEQQGFPFFSGTGIYRKQLSIPDRPTGAIWRLDLTGVSVSGELWLDGHLAGTILGNPTSFRLPPTWSGTLALELHVRNTAANRYYHDTTFAETNPQPSGLMSPPRLTNLVQRRETARPP